MSAHANDPFWSSKATALQAAEHEYCKLVYGATREPADMMAADREQLRASRARLHTAVHEATQELRDLTLQLHNSRLATEGWQNAAVRHAEARKVLQTKLAMAGSTIRAICATISTTLNSVGLADEAHNIDEALKGALDVIGTTEPPADWLKMLGIDVSCIHGPCCPVCAASKLPREEHEEGHPPAAPAPTTPQQSKWIRVGNVVGWCCFGNHEGDMHGSAELTCAKCGRSKPETPSPLDEGGKCTCCPRGDEYNGFGSDGPLIFVCPKSCACHD